MPWENIPGCIDTLTKVPTLRCIPAVFQNIVQAALTFAGIVALFFIIFGGYKFISSGGDPKQAEEGKKTITYAIAGLILILLSFFILAVISAVTGVNCIQKFGFDTCK